MNLIMLAGIPGAGKSTFARSILTGADRIVSSDDIRKHIFKSLKAAHEPAIKAEANKQVFNTFHDKINNYLYNGWNVIADATFLTRSSREKVVEIAKRHGAATHLILFKNLSQADMRNARRDEDAFVPEDVMAHMHTKYHNTLSELPQEDYDTVTKIESFE